MRRETSVFAFPRQVVRLQPCSVSGFLGVHTSSFYFNLIRYPPSFSCPHASCCSLKCRLQETVSPNPVPRPIHLLPSHILEHPVQLFLTPQSFAAFPLLYLANSPPVFFTTFTWSVPPPTNLLTSTLICSVQYNACLLYTSRCI